MTQSIFVSPYLADGSTGGGLVSSMNLQSMQKITNVVQAFALSNSESCNGFTCLNAPAGRWATALCNLLSVAGRLKPRTIVKIVSHLLVLRPDVLFLDSSSLGWLALWCKIVSPGTRVISFFHNIEFDFQIERSRAEGRQYLLSAFAEYINERLTARFSTHLLMLTSEDSRRSISLYGREADKITPVVLNDSLENAMEASDPARRSPIVILFIGSNFFANRQAVDFLIHQLAPKIRSRKHIEIWVAGSVFSPEEWKGDLPNNVRILGRVGNLSELYMRAAAVAVPVTAGAGMKVKVAEALMHGCPVIGTPLALRGYKDNSSSADHLQVASSPDQYDAAIQFILENQEGLRKAARADYIQRFSAVAGEERLRQIIDRT